MSKLNKKFLTIVSVVATMVAASIANSACYFAAYQPEEPKCLRDE